MTRVAVAGAGISGLAIAWNIMRRSPGTEVILLEQADLPGGNIRTERRGGYVCESGPNGFLDNAPATTRLVRDLGLEPRLAPSRDAARRRYILHRGQLCEVPSSIRGFVGTPLLSLGGKLRVACEPFAARRRTADESVWQFASRRIGREAAATLVDAMVSGVYAGDIAALSLRDAFPTMWQIEEDHGGLFRGLVARRRKRRPGDAIGAPSGRLTSFAGGMADLTEALAGRLGRVLRTRTPVLAVHRRPPGAASGPAFRLDTPRGTIDADAVVLSGPAEESARMLEGEDRTLGHELRGIPAAPLAVVCLGYGAEAVTRRGGLDGFGFLVPRAEGLRTLGVLWESSIYDGRAPQGRVLLRVMVGGALDAGAASLGDDELLRTAAGDLARTMGMCGTPEFVRIIRHRRGIPQYVLGHAARLARIAARLRAWPGLHLAGSSYRGVSLNACVEEAERIAAAVLEPGRLEPAA